MTDNSEHSFSPNLPVQNNPLFSWPLDIRAVLGWYRHAWDIPSELLLLLGLAGLTAFWLQPVLVTDGTISLSALLWMYLRNVIYLCLVAGGLHLLFYRWRTQGTAAKYETAFLHRPSNRFLFGNQVFDNMFFSLVSGVTIWTGYEVLLLWAQANNPALYLTFSAAPVWFVALFVLIPIFESAHFYLVHRLLHMKPFYDRFHALHHRNVNTGPWSGISMHPVEHLIYFSSVLVHLVIPSHPIHIFFHLYLLTLSPAAGHCGFDNLILAGKQRLALGHYHHHLHHRHFDCNYGSSEMPWDVWFGSFHDGTKSGQASLRRHLKPSADKSRSS
ncbi:sterol desaturase [SAR116 cluster alpha proteobacterium HIMB100]|nr:sterol desaturase [SAR116 cluster alpha proteobacterium HIMB100]